MQLCLSAYNVLVIVCSERPGQLCVCAFSLCLMRSRKAGRKAFYADVRLAKRLTAGAERH